jgi:hypothetical protein
MNSCDIKTLHFDNVLSVDDIEYLLNLPEVISAKQNIDSKTKGSVYFSIPLSSDLKNKINDKLNLDLTSYNSIPMRWIKGDTLPHVDKGASSFDNTYLMYLTDSEGQLIVENNSFPISKGSAYVFSEGLHHETINTGNEPRLLLGPMSEKVFAVGASPNLYIRQSGSDIQESYNITDWTNITFWPYTVYSNTVEFVTDITLTSADQFFICGTNNIQIGSTSLNVDGTRPKIDISGVSDYLGLIQNGNDSNNGYNNVNVFNLEVRAVGGSTLYVSEGPGSGWVCQQYFGKGATGNYVVNCYSDGPINIICGGIVGPYSGSGSGAQLTIIGCSSSGQIDYLGGGIAGLRCGSNGGNIRIASSWSTGDISGNDSGGIVGSGVAADGGYILLNYCYSEGAINGNGAGGIVGASAGDAGDGVGIVNVGVCYSKGNMSGSMCGGIMGKFWSGQIQIYNCYSTGNITAIDDIGAIAGPSESTNSFQISNCYATGSTANALGYILGGQSNVSTNVGDWILQNNYSEAENSSSGWNSTNANTVLQGLPNPVIGDLWISTGTNQPYELYYMGYSPYTKENIYFIGNEPTLNNIFPPVGENPKKDMENQIYTDRFDPNVFQSDLFPDLSDFVDGNIVVGDKDESNRLIASNWSDLGDDVFDQWGFFYLYDVNTGKYYFPLLSPQNQEDGIITTQTFNTFGRTFTIKHGWSIRGVFKIDVSVADDLPFRFGAYGNVDDQIDSRNLDFNYTLDGQQNKLYYHGYRESDDEHEMFYSYFIPKNEAEKYIFPYDVYYKNPEDHFSIMTKELTTGVTIYFSKERDVREYVVNELKVAATESSISYELSPGETGKNALITGKSYSILRKRKFVAYVDYLEFQSIDLSDNTITINSTTGVISTTSATPIGQYEILVRNNGSYHISTYVLIVKEGESEPEPEPTPETLAAYSFNNINRTGVFIEYKFNGAVAWKRYRSWWRRWPKY